MSSTTFKNLIQRREHKERSQPAHRSRFGLLEKHKDYVQRAKNYHDKEKRIIALKRRASMRNPDEFYFGMHKSKTEGGVHTKAREDVPQLTAEELELLKTQDRAYIQTIISAERKVRAYCFCCVACSAWRSVLHCFACAATRQRSAAVRLLSRPCCAENRASGSLSARLDGNDHPPRARDTGNVQCARP